MFSSDTYAQILAFGATAAVVSGTWYVLARREAADHRRVIDRLRGHPGRSAGEGPDAPKPSTWARVVRKVGSMVESREKAAVSGLRTRLVHAGYYKPAAVAQFYGLRTLLTLGSAAVGGSNAAVIFETTWTTAVACAGVGGAVGFLAPSVILESQVNKRKRYLNGALPDAIDIMVMCVESGVSLNAAVDWVTDEIRAVHPPLGAELGLVRREMQLGLTAGEAFRHFADRSGVDQVRDLSAVLIQSERHGASIGKALRNYADMARQERQMWAEEMSQKAAVKIVFPTLLCIFPAMFIVLLGPAAMQMSKLFAK